jgi:predicted lipid-binding transport protein (Tim44 family)
MCEEYTCLGFNIYGVIKNIMTDVAGWSGLLLLRYIVKQSFLRFFLTVIVVALFSQGIVSEAQAKRFGGGASFGSRPSFGKSFKRAPVKRTLSPVQKQAAAKNQTLRNNLNKRGGMMGMLGALAMGGLLGSLLFGGAFENFNMVDMLLIGGVLYIIFKLMTMRARQAVSPQSYARHTSNNNNFDSIDDTQTQSRDFNTDLMFKNNQAASQQSNADSDDSAAVIEIDDFDAGAFLEGANRAFHLLQSAWDRGDQAEIRGMTTDKVFAEIKQQLQDQNTANHTEIMSLNTELLSARQQGNELQVQVLFDANIHELPESITSNVQELWHFVRPANQHGSMWFVDGIQQVE